MGGKSQDPTEPLPICAHAAPCLAACPGDSDCIWGRPRLPPASGQGAGAVCARQICLPGCSPTRPQQSDQHQAASHPRLGHGATVPSQSSSGSRGAGTLQQLLGPGHMALGFLGAGCPELRQGGHTQGTRPHSVSAAAGEPGHHGCLGGETAAEGEGVERKRVGEVCRVLGDPS